VIYIYALEGNGEKKFKDWFGETNKVFVQLVKK
jgi:hypothetical protein